VDLQLLQSGRNQIECMKTRYILLYIILLLTTSQTTFCQSNCICLSVGKTTTEPYLSGELFTSEVPLDTVTFFNNEWLPGDIYLVSGGILKNKKIRYNGLVDELFCLNSLSNCILKLDKEAIIQFHFHNLQGDTSVYFKKIKVKRSFSPDTTEIFVQIMFQGNLSLYVLHNFHLNDKKEVQINNKLIQKDIYKEVPFYYLKFLNGEMVGFKRFNRKTVYSFAPGKKDQIRKFLKEGITGRINTNQEIIRLAEYLSSIIDQ
jgi:hypothetical protein